MEEDGRKIPIRSVLIAAGTAGIVIFIVGQQFLGERVRGLILPALIMLFIGRSMNRSRRRRPIEDLPQASPPSSKPRATDAPAPTPAVPQRRTPAAPSAKPKPSPSQVDDDYLEKALAAYRQAPDAEGDRSATLPPLPTTDIEFKPKTSAEMIEEAKRRLKQSR